MRFPIMYFTRVVFSASKNPEPALKVFHDVPATDKIALLEPGQLLEIDMFGNFTAEYEVISRVTSGYNSYELYYLIKRIE